MTYRPHLLETFIRLIFRLEEIVTSIRALNAHVAATNEVSSHAPLVAPRQFIGSGPSLKASHSVEGQFKYPILAYLKKVETIYIGLPSYYKMLLLPMFSTMCCRPTREPTSVGQITYRIACLRGWGLGLKSSESLSTSLLGSSSHGLDVDEARTWTGPLGLRN